MSELVRCLTCISLINRGETDGKCRTCDAVTCIHCKRVCERCDEIFCMFHVETKVVMRQQKPFLHKLCKICREVWQ